MWGAESRPGGSFSNLFSDAMSLGLISPRRALNETVEYERQRNGGRLSPFGFSTFTGKAAVHTLEANEVGGMRSQAPLVSCSSFRPILCGEPKRM